MFLCVIVCVCGSMILWLLYIRIECVVEMDCAVWWCIIVYVRVCIYVCL